jgi:hypothetical protein
MIDSLKCDPGVRVFKFRRVWFVVRGFSIESFDRFLPALRCASGVSNVFHN